MMDAEALLAKMSAVQTSVTAIAAGRHRDELLPEERAAIDRLNADVSGELIASIVMLIPYLPVWSLARVLSAILREGGKEASQ